MDTATSPAAPVAAAASQNIADILNDTVKAHVEAAVNELVASGRLVEDIITKAKAKDTAGIIADAPQALAIGKELMSDVPAIVTAVKAGKSSSEFWLSFVTIIGIGTFAALGHPLPMSAAAAAAAVAGIYTMMRTVAKK